MVLLASCAFQKNNTTMKLKICGSYGVPGMLTYDLKGTETAAEIMEIDTEGRVLFSYIAKSCITEKREQILAICQKADDEYVYFYEDNCYLLHGYTQEDIETLKESNDWGSPLDESKMSRRSSKTSIDLFLIGDTNIAPIDMDKLKEQVMKELNAARSEIIECLVLDRDAAGNGLAFLHVFRDGQNEKYFVFTNSVYAVDFLEIEEGIIDTYALAAFKKENKWKYGF